MKVDVFIKELLDLQSKGDKDGAIELVYDKSDEFLRLAPSADRIWKDVVVFDNLMGALLDKELEHWLMMPFLTLSKPYKGAMNNRDAFYGQFVQRCILENINGNLKEEHLLSSIKRLV